MNKDQDKMIQISLSEATTPQKGLHDILMDRWWLTRNGEPLFWDASVKNIPHLRSMSHPRKDIAEQLIKAYQGSYEVDPEPKQIPIVYLKVDPRIYEIL